VKSRLIVNPVSGSDSAPSQLTLNNARLREHVGAMDIVMTVENAMQHARRRPLCATAMITCSLPAATAR
jgi:hypothetical protein